MGTTQNTNRRTNRRRTGRIIALVLVASLVFGVRFADGSHVSATMNATATTVGE